MGWSSALGTYRRHSVRPAWNLPSELFRRVVTGEEGQGLCLRPVMSDMNCIHFTMYPVLHHHLLQVIYESQFQKLLEWFKPCIILINWWVINTCYASILIIYSWGNHVKLLYTFIIVSFVFFVVLEFSEVEVSFHGLFIDTGKKKLRPRTVALIVVLVVAPVTLLGFGSFLLLRRSRKNRRTILRENCK